MTILGNLLVWLALIGELVNTVVQFALALLLEIWQGDGRHHGRVAGLRAADPGRVGAGVSGLDRPADRPVAKCAAARFNGPDFAIGTLWSEHLQPLWQQLTMALGAVMNLVLTVNTVPMPLAASAGQHVGPGSDASI